MKEAVSTGILILLFAPGQGDTYSYIYSLKHKITNSGGKVIVLFPKKTFCSTIDVKNVVVFLVTAGLEMKILFSYSRTILANFPDRCYQHSASPAAPAAVLANILQN
jgi:hypothetical protein